ncbi:choice-of-anchor I family protein [Pseudochryseolinea flava]|uniref:Alkaline phosphatase n=1 Tax=Pseudochryseolinea flava TaxID=2059302 RepID=A0A364XXC7_9BACT|nr:choice-of-anchor I family protein [Pseudochryseolinea flava]RAV98198.1 alkaline phosphatase [Pseudochryseolinea flava]
MKKNFTHALILSALLFGACGPGPGPAPGSYFKEVDEIQLVGGATAAEISAFDPKTKRLFVINAVKAAIDVIDMRDPLNLVYEREISISAYGHGVNSLSVKNGLLAAAVESSPKTALGKVVIWETTTLNEKDVVTVGSLPDMLSFSHDGRYIVVANEGEPNEDYTVDPNGSVSIITVHGGSFQVVTTDFSSFNSQASALTSKGYRIAGPVGTTLAADTEPEYVTISDDDKTAWVTLQENNGIARVNLLTKKIERIFPLGFKDHSAPGNELDGSDKDGGVNFANYPVRGMYMPDGIASFSAYGTPLLVTVNEGDSRIRPTSDDALPPYGEGDLFNEEARIADVTLDSIKFPNFALLQSSAKLGRLKITNRMGDTDGDGDYDALYTFGARSFSIWNGHTGAQVFDSGSDLEQFLISQRPSGYDDARSDDKGVEPENVAIGQIGPRTLAFVGLERADAIAVVDVTNPQAPKYLQILATGDAPEGVLFINGKDSPNGIPTVVASCEGDGRINVYQLSVTEQYE